MILTPGALSSREHKTLHILKGKCRYNVYSGAARVYKWQNSFSAPIPFPVCDDNVTVETFISLSNSSLQSQRRVCCITVYRGDASSSGPKRRSHRNTIPPTIDAGKYGINSCGLQISNFIKMTKGRSVQVNTSTFTG